MVALRHALLASFVAVLVTPLSPTASAGHSYDQPVWFNWGTTQLDVLVLTPNDASLGAATERAIDAWTVGIPQFSSTLDLDLRIYWPAKGQAAPLDFRTDIAVAPQGFFAVHPGVSSASFGIPKCYAFAPMVGWGPAYRVIAHEFGHCLGLGHVFNHGVEYSPNFDLMGNGSQDPACPSNLNVAVLERAFGGEGGTVTIGSGQYQQASC